jgi:hypothetical protein
MKVSTNHTTETDAAVEENKRNVASKRAENPRSRKQVYAYLRAVVTEADRMRTLKDHCELDGRGDPVTDRYGTNKLNSWAICKLVEWSCENETIDTVCRFHATNWHTLLITQGLTVDQFEQLWEQQQEQYPDE